MDMLHDKFFWAFIATALILGWVYGRFRTFVGPLHDTITKLRLERDAQAGIIQYQRTVIRELEKKVERVPGSQGIFIPKDKGQ